MSEQDIQEIKTDIKDILKILNGNGRIGLVAKSQMCYDWMLNVKSDKNNIAMFVYRGILVLILGFIATKVGLK